MARDEYDLIIDLKGMLEHYVLAVWDGTTRGQAKSVLKDATLFLYGEPCPDYDPDCPTCRAWDNYRKL